MNRQKLKQILGKLDELEGKTSGVEVVDGDIVATAERLVNDQLDTVRKSLSTGPLVQELSKLNQEIKSIKSNFDLKPVLTKIDRITATFNSLSKEVTKLEKLSQKDQRDTSAKLSEGIRNFSLLKSELETLKKQKDVELQNFRKDIPALKASTTAAFQNVYTRLDRMAEEEANKRDEVSPIKREVEALRTDVIGRINNLHRGGSMNRNVAINGNTSVLSRYTDINLKAGSNITLAYTKNDTTKYTDITITSSGGGGGSGYQSVFGSVNGVNKVFVYGTAPNAIVVDGQCLQKTASDTTINWTGTTTVTLAVAPNYDTFAVA